MTDETKRILGMVKDGKISVEEAEELIAALGGQAPAEPALAESSGLKKNLKYFRVLVEPKNGHSKHGKVNVRIPIALVRAGAKLTTILPKDARDKIDDAFKHKGMGLKVSELEGANLDPIIEALGEMSIDVDSDDAKIKVFCE